MLGWTLASIPLAFLTYFMAFPSQLGQLLNSLK